jgi:Helix-hairpin-helix motif
MRVSITFVCVLLALSACAAHRLVDLNAAPSSQIATLPGMTAADAERVVANRPYYAPGDLVARRIIDAAQYKRLSDHVFLGPPAPPDYLNWVPPEE